MKRYLTTRESLGTEEFTPPSDHPEAVPIHVTYVPSQILEADDEQMGTYRIHTEPYFSIVWECTE